MVSESRPIPCRLAIHILAWQSGRCHHTAMTNVAAPLIVAAVLFSPVPAYGWSESGHHLIALLAFDHLSSDEQRQVLDMLKAHPRYAKDFTPPPKVRNADRFRIGTAGYWPDIARSQPEYNRPNWHYQLGATLTMGDPAQVRVHETPGPCPDSADLRTSNLHIAQAVELCGRVMADRNSPAGDKRLRVLVSSSCRRRSPALPCREHVRGRIVPQGDRGANSIPTNEKNNRPRLVGFAVG